MSVAVADVRDLINELEEVAYLLDSGDFQSAYDELENQQGTIGTIASHIEELL